MSYIIIIFCRTSFEGSDCMLNVIDLFCGCGGLSEGFKLAGYNVVAGIDFNAPAIETYKKNFPKAKEYY